jgi:hypothetical protein
MLNPSNLTYELAVIKGNNDLFVALRGLSPDYPLGYTVLDAFKYPCKPETLELMRKYGKKQAKVMKTTFTDKTL